MKKVKSLQEYLDNTGLNEPVIFPDGAFKNPTPFPLQGLEVKGAILFADLPEYSLKSKEYSPAECAFLTNQYFAWMEGSAIRKFGGIIDKFIGDELMVVFIKDHISKDPLKDALYTAKFMLDKDAFAFEPKIGIAAGDFIIAKVGTDSVNFVSALGHTVNLAARCVQNAKGEDIREGNTIRVATNNINLIKDMFIENYWEIEGPKKADLKNINGVDIIDIKCKLHYFPQFDHSEWIKAGIKEAYNSGAIKRLYK